MAVVVLSEDRLSLAGGDDVSENSRRHEVIVEIKFRPHGLCPLVFANVLVKCS